MLQFYDIPMPRYVANPINTGVARGRIRVQASGHGILHHDLLTLF